MFDFLENTICQFHQLQTIAVDLNPHIEIEKKQLCPKCLVTRESSNYLVVLNEEFKAIVKEIMINKYQNQRRIYEESQSNYKEICSKLQNYQDHFNANIKKTLSLIDHYVQDQKKQFGQIMQPNDSINKQDLLIFIEQSNSARPTQKSIQNLIDKDQEFQKLLQDQFQNLHQEDSYLELTKLVDQIQESNQSKEVSFDIYSQYLNTKKTSNLQHQCRKHGKEIIMLAINEKYQQDRLVCVDCIPNITTKLTTLEEANKMWLILQGEMYESNNEFLNDRGKIQQQIQAIISKYSIKERMLQHEIMQLIEIQNKDIKQKLADLELNKNKKQLMQLKQQEITTIIDLLAKNDRMSQVKEFQMKLKFDDQKYSKEIFFKLNEIEQHYQNRRQELFKLFGMNDQLSQDSQIQIDRFQQEIENSQLDSGIFTNLIPQFYNQLYQIKLVLMQRVSDKGHEYIKQLNDADFNIKNKEQEQMNILKYKDILSQFDRYYKIMINQIDQRYVSIQTENNVNDDSQSQTMTQQIGKQRELSINSINKVQFKSEINKSELQDQLIQTNENLNNTFQMIVDSTKIHDSTVISINQQQQNNSLNTSNYAKLLKFSTSLKHSSIIISADGNSAKSTSNATWGLCLCDQPIPKDGTVVVDFKVKYLDCLMAGVYLIDSINKNFVQSNGIGKGCYFLYHNGNIYSHHDKDKQGQMLGFPIQKNDIISMEVNVQQKQITWRNKTKNQFYTLDIQTTSELYFCFQLFGKNKIKLL